MRSSLIAAGLGVLLLLGAGIYTLRPHAVPTPPPPLTQIVTTNPQKQIIGPSVQGRQIEAYTFGTGKEHLVFVGGIHGGYEWNSVLLAYNFLDYLNASPSTVPASETITIILDANPDAVYKAIGKEGRFTLADVPKGDLSAERFNAHDVDLNRNFDCKWQPTSTWQNKAVSAGTAPFSEPEAQALRDYFEREKPTAVVFWHSAAGGVYASQCGRGILPATLKIMNTYASATGYPAIKEFDAYPTTGASEDWLASIGIPAVTVELSTHDSIEWEKNLKGILALMHAFQ